MTGKRWLALGIAAMLFLVSTIVNFTSALLSRNFSNLFEGMASGESMLLEEVVESGNPLKKIALLEVNGTILDTGTSSIFASGGYVHQDFMEQLNHVKNDDLVKAIILRINSPGGGVNESAEIYDKIMEIKEETEKPIYVSMGSMAASGGYYIAAPADKIFASKETITGSIGVIMQGYNFSELAEKIGIDVVTIKSGPYKDIFSEFREMTEEEKQILHSMMENSYNEFVRIIAVGRNMPESKVRELADGRIYDGYQAKEVGLIDEFGYQEDVIKQLREDFDLQDAQVVRYSPNFGFGSFFRVAAQNIFGKQAETHRWIDVITNANAPRLMYLYSQ